MRRDRRSELQRDISEQGATKVWKCIRSVIASKRCGQNVQPDLSADDLNSFFVSVGPQIAAEIRSENTTTDLNVRLPRVGACGFRPRAISFGELGHIVFHMRNFSASGADGV